MSGSNPHELQGVWTIMHRILRISEMISRILYNKKTRMAKIHPIIPISGMQQTLQDATLYNNKM